MLTLLIAILMGPGPQPLKVPLTPVVAGRPVIAHLVSRDHVVSITTGPDGTLYSAKTKDGVIVATGLTLQQLQERHPTIYRRLHPAIAPAATADASARGPEPILLDASIRD